ncbi:MAG: HEAT repeat domain-containing protein [Thermoleophilia bacterium]
MPDPAAKVISASSLSAEARPALERLRVLAADLVELLYADEADDEACVKAGELLIEIGPAAVEALVAFIRRDPKRGRDDAAGILSEIGPAAVEPLIACFAEDDPDVRATAAFIFTTLRDPDGGAEQPLLELLDDPDELVRQSAAYALAALECRRAVPKLIALATRPVQMPQRDADAWAAAYPYDCSAAVDALGRLDDPRAVRPLLFIIETQGVDGPLYEEAVRALGLLGDERAAQVVRRAFAHGEYEGEHVDALAAMHGRGALEDLLGLAESEDAEARRVACQDLIRLGSPVAAETVADLLVDANESVRSAAREALSWTVEEHVLAEIVAGLEDPSPEVRAWTTSLLPLACAWSD